MNAHVRMLGGLAAAILAASAAVPTAAAESPTATDSPAATESPAPGSAALRVWLKGAFGRALGGLPADPATALPDERALDAWMRRAPLELTTEVPFEDVLDLSVVARPIDSAEEQVLSTGATGFEGPDVPGLHLVVATLETDPGGSSEHAWLVDVPDRSGSPELLWDIPGPIATVVSAAGAVAGVPGHGCYAYLCVETGYRPSADSLEPLPVRVGETPRLRLDDGSAMVHWQGRLEPGTGANEGGPAPAQQAQDAFADQPQATIELTGLAPTEAGEWLLEVRADYDRERGWQWFLFRLIAE